MNEISIIVVIIILVSIPLAFLFYVLKNQNRMILHNLTEELSNSNEKVLIESEPGSFRGAKTTYGRIKCDGIITITKRRIIFVKLIGNRIEIDLKDIDSVNEEKFFLGAVRAGKNHLVISMKDGNQIGFFVKDINKWISMLSQEISDSKF